MKAERYAIRDTEGGSGTVIILLFHFGPYRVALVPRSPLRGVVVKGRELCER